MKPHHIDSVMITEDRIRHRLRELAETVSADLSPTPDRAVILIGILRGSFVFIADLIRELHRHGVRTRVDFMILESYGAGTESSGTVRLVQDFSIPVTGEPVLLVDDILDSGRTLTFAREHIRARGGQPVRTCVLLDKKARRVVPFEADYVGFPIPDDFVVGYGLDYDGCHRELPHLARVTFL